MICGFSRSGEILLDAAGELGDVRTIEGADWDLEIGCITELSAEKHGPILLFDSIKGYDAGYRVAANVLASPQRFALAMGLPIDLPALEILRAWKDKSARAQMIKPRVVPAGPILENVLEGDAADLLKFPAPRWHERDGGRYIGTADIVINQDPDTGWVNAATYRRHASRGRARLSLWMNPDRDGRYIAREVLGSRASVSGRGRARLRARDVDGGACEAVARRFRT